MAEALAPGGIGGGIGQPSATSEELKLSMATVPPGGIGGGMGQPSA
jgi:hypothetical protein